MKIAPLRILAAPAVIPAVLLVFGLLYVGIAISTDEALVALMATTKGSWPLLALLSLPALSSVARIFLHVREWRERRRVSLSGGAKFDGLYDESVSIRHLRPLCEAAERLRREGFRVTERGPVVFAVRGVSDLLLRLVALLGLALVFAGLSSSLIFREVTREALIEGEPVPEFLPAGLVTRSLRLTEGEGIFLRRDLDIEIAPVQGGAGKHFGVYPPGRAAGLFVYPRYLGVAPLVEFSAPDFSQGISKYSLLMLYPPGTEDSVEIPGTPYRLFVKLADVSDEDDPFVTGRFLFNVRIERGGQPVLERRFGVGEVVTAEGHRLAFPEVKRFVATDFIRDPGVLLVWSGSLFLTLLVLSPILRLLCPRREIVLLESGDEAVCLSRREGRRRRHDEFFHGLLDLLNRVKQD